MKIVERVNVGGRGQGSLIRREGVNVWYFRYSFRGKEHEDSTGTADLKAARRFAKNKLDDMAVARKGKGAYQPATAAKVSVSELLDDLEADYRLRKVKSWVQIQSHVKPIRAHFGDMRAGDVTGRTVDAYIEACVADELAAATINRRLQILGQAFKHAAHADQPKVAGVPRIRHLPERNVRQGFFEADDFARLVAALPDDLQDFVRFAYLTGWRSGEIKALRWEWIEQGVIRLPDSKNGRGRVLVIDGELTALIKRREQARLVDVEGAERVVDLVFHRAGIPIVDIRKAWSKACIAAGLSHVERDAAGKTITVPDKLFHDLRRTAIRNLTRRGVQETVAMQISGHRTRAVFDRYNIVSEADLRRAMQTAALPGSAPALPGEFPGRTSD